ncbi:MAG: hypothetical protein COV35_03340 [Alphaproteobacteria bacterium CG11_big_fil_rev_8_21_14_0_20_39_49]|nr:MAG: hypothetical protein COV35_03340 [Alphaproteobacteria bacterium CG11_big_fil_rev_8_21_14_0_20_39_49]
MHDVRQKNYVKHIVLFVLINYIAIFIFNFLISLESFVYQQNFSFDIKSVILSSVFIVVFTMLFTLVPYLIALIIISSSIQKNIYQYILGGVCSPFFIYLIVLILTDKSSVALHLLLTGAISGAVYYFLDKIAFPCKEENK